MKCLKCEKPAENDDILCNHCGFSIRTVYAENTWDELLLIIKGRDHYSIDTLLEIENELIVRDKSSEAQEMDQYIQRRQRNETEVTMKKPTSKASLIVGLILGGIGLVSFFASMELKKDPEYQLANMIQEFGNDGRHNIDLVDVLHAIGIYGILLGIVLILYFSFKVRKTQAMGTKTDQGSKSKEI